MRQGGISLKKIAISLVIVLPPEAFSKIKGILREDEARTRVALVEAMGRALTAVTSRDARGSLSTAATVGRSDCYETRCRSQIRVTWRNTVPIRVAGVA